MSRVLPIALAAVAIVAYSCVQRYLALRRQIAIAKTTNIPYVVLRELLLLMHDTLC